jgi:hypothetical protein
MRRSEIRQDDAKLITGGEVGNSMVAGRAFSATIFFSLLLVQGPSAAADPGPSLGMPSNVRIHRDATTQQVALTWAPPADAAPGATYTYEVRRDNVRVYSGSGLGFEDQSPASAALYTITAIGAAGSGASAFAVYTPAAVAVVGHPVCFPVEFHPEPKILWDCLPLQP